MKPPRKIDLMHELFGQSDGHRCGDCTNFISGRYRDRVLRKCTAYGITHSEASDWANRWEACGLFCKSYSGRSVIEIAKRRAYHQPDTEVPEGQIGIDDLLVRGDRI